MFLLQGFALFSVFHKLLFNEKYVTRDVISAFFCNVLNLSVLSNRVAGMMKTFLYHLLIGEGGSSQGETHRRKSREYSPCFSLHIQSQQCLSRMMTGLQAEGKERPQKIVVAPDGCA
jgi:hypothetical protein